MTAHRAVWGRIQQVQADGLERIAAESTGLQSHQDEVPSCLSLPPSLFSSPSPSSFPPSLPNWFLSCRIVHWLYHVQRTARRHARGCMCVCMCVCVCVRVCVCVCVCVCLPLERITKMRFRASGIRR